MEAQFWDTSAFVSLFYREPFTEQAHAARRVAERYLAWDWLVLESWSAFMRRGCSPAQRRARQRLLRHFALVGLGEGQSGGVQRLITRHHLRSADAGHLHCLRQVKRLLPGVSLVCCDGELVTAARAEGIAVWG